MPISNYYRNKNLSELNGKYIGLFETAPSYSDSGSETTVTRVPVNLVKVSDGVFKNSEDIKFSYDSSTDNKIAFWGIYDQLVGGNLLWSENFTTPVTLMAGVAFVVKKYTLEIEMK